MPIPNEVSAALTSAFFVALIATIRGCFTMNTTITRLQEQLNQTQDDVKEHREKLAGHDLQFAQITPTLARIEANIIEIRAAVDRRQFHQSQ